MISPFHFFNLEGRLLLIIMVMTFFLSDRLSHYAFTKNLFCILVVAILFANLFSLSPFMFCITAYLWGVFLFTISWVMFIIMFKFYKDCDDFLRHLLPSNRPLVLWDLLAILETLRNLIRPITLSLRLSCNLITGHVLISLTLTTSSTLILIILIIFETGIRIIQSQVFSILARSYLFR